MYNFANSNLKKKNLTMQRGDPRGVRGVSFAVRTCAYKHACAISSATIVRVTYAGVTSEIPCAYTRLLCLWRRIYSRFLYFRYFNAAALRITRAYVRPVRNESRTTVKRSTVTGTRANRFGLSNLSTRPIDPSISIVHEWGQTIRTGYSGETARFLAHSEIRDMTSAYVFHGAVPNRNRVANLSNYREKLSRYIG